MYNRITDPSSINKAILPIKESKEVAGTDKYLDEYKDNGIGGLKNTNGLKKVIKEIKVLSAIVILGASLYYLFFWMNIDYLSSQGLKFQVIEYRTKDRTLTIGVEGYSSLTENSSIEYENGDSGELYVRLKKPLIAGKTNAAEQTYWFYIDNADSVYYQGKKGEEPVLIWSVK